MQFLIVGITLLHNFSLGGCRLDGGRKNKKSFPKLN